jgi:hypothetical protein
MLTIRAKTCLMKEENFFLDALREVMRLATMISEIT